MKSQDDPGNRMLEQSNKYHFLFVSAPFGGVEVFFRNLRELLSARDDIDSTWVWIELHPKEWIAHIPPISVNWTLKAGFVARQRIRALERSGKRFDAVFFNHAIPPTFLQDFRRRVPTVLLLDATPLTLERYARWYYNRTRGRNRLAQKLKHSITRKVYADAVYIFTMSTLEKESLTKDYAIREDKISVVPPGINLRKWTRPPQEEHTEGITSGRPKVLFVGGDFIRKGGDLLLRVTQREEFKQCDFHIVTKDAVGSVGDNVRIFNNLSANSDQLMALYREANVFVLPTRADFSPHAIWEAMAMELPIITTDVGALSEIVIDGESGYLVPADDEAAFAYRLRTLVQDHQLCARLGKSGRKLAEAKFDLQKNAAIMVEILKKAARREVT